MTSAWRASDTSIRHSREGGNPVCIFWLGPRFRGGDEESSVRRALSIRTVAKGAGAVVIGIIALDLVATVATLALGATWLRR